MLHVLHVLPHAGGGGETYIDRLEAMEGVSHERARLAAGRSPASAALSIPGGYPALVARARRADIVHAHGDVAAILALPLLRARPSVWTTHGLHLLRRSQQLPLRALKSGLRQVIRATAATICTSDAERDDLRTFAPPTLGARLRTVHNGIEATPAPTREHRERARRDLELDSGDLVVLFLGELAERKRPLVAVAAVRRARAAGAPVTLLVAGDGPQAAAVRAQAGAGVQPLGHRDDVPALLAAADVLLMPSEREGLSFAVLEAMGAGLAPVVSDAPGNPEAVGEAGIVTPLDDVAALACALQQLAADRAAVARLGAAARERVATTLTADRLRAGVLDAYRCAR